MKIITATAMATRTRAVRVFRLRSFIPRTCRAPRARLTAPPSRGLSSWGMAMGVGRGLLIRGACTAIGGGVGNGVAVGVGT